MQNPPRTLRTVDLQHVTGGFQTPQGMAPPKYSAGWWDLVRKSGAPK